MVSRYRVYVGKRPDAFIVIRRDRDTSFSARWTRTNFDRVDPGYPERSGTLAYSCLLVTPPPWFVDSVSMTGLLQ